MTLPGGPAAKLGDRYEGWWTLSEFLRMLGGETEAIRIEDASADKTEFVVTAGSSRELHQAKRSHPAGKWSLSTLQSDGPSAGNGSAVGWQQRSICLCVGQRRKGTRRPVRCRGREIPWRSAMEGLRAVIRCCTPENRVRMEEVILGYYAPFERARSGNRWKGHSQFSLLSAFPAALRSPRANLRFAELERKFGEPEGEPTPISADWIGPPIEKHGTDRMTDDQWLSAIAKYRTEFPAYSPSLIFPSLSSCVTLNCGVGNRPDSPIPSASRSVLSIAFITAQ